MNLIDTHVHLYWESYQDDLKQVIQRSLQAGVTIVINAGVDVAKSQTAIDIAKQLTSKGLQSFALIGIHPHEAPRYAQGKLIQPDIERLEQIYLTNKDIVVGIGECGLDFSSTSEESSSTSLGTRKPASEVFLQKQLFQAQINLAKKLNLPLIVHCRDDRSKDPQNSECWTDTLNVVGNYPTVLHCYSGLLPTTNYILQTTNLIVSFAANITYPKNEYLREAVRILPLEKIILETDSPFLAPQSKRGQRNEPSAVLEIAILIADLKGLPLKEVAWKTSENAKRLFKI